MARWDEARAWVERALEVEGRGPGLGPGPVPPAQSEGVKELLALREEIAEKLGEVREQEAFTD
ncbi:hypothetical protein VTN02DRAFT_66 [Thermoascus thermophilus]